MLKKGVDIIVRLCYNIITVKEVIRMKKQNQKPTAFEIAYLVIEAIVAISTLITAIKWW